MVCTFPEQWLRLFSTVFKWYFSRFTSMLFAIVPELLKLLEQVRPAWNEGNVKLKVFEGGLTNSLVGVSCGDEDMLLVRIYGCNTEIIKQGFRSTESGKATQVFGEVTNICSF